MTSTKIFTKDEMVFVQRMLPHFMAGKSAEEAAQAVLDDDARLFEALHSIRAVSMGEGAAGDGPAMPCYSETVEGKGLRAALSAYVYESIRLPHPKAAE